jgi:hypothetical protein
MNAYPSIFGMRISVMIKIGFWRAMTSNASSPLRAVSTA